MSGVVQNTKVLLKMYTSLKYLHGTNYINYLSEIWICIDRNRYAIKYSASKHEIKSAHVDIE